MSDCFLQFASFTDRFVGCISNYFETNPDEKKELTNEKQKKKFRNPRIFLFDEPKRSEKPKGSEKPKRKKNVKLKSKYATVNTGKSIQKRYDTPENPGMLNSEKPPRLYCMDSVCSTLLILAYYLNRNKISTEEYYSCIDSMIESLSDISIEIESSENTDNLINELLHSRKEILDDHYGTKVEENYNYNHEEYKEMDIKLSLDGLEQALTRIREESLNSERIKNYINIIMVRLLLTRYVRLLEKKEIQFYGFFNSIVSEIIGNDAIFMSKYFDFMLEDSDIPNFESAVNTIDKLQIIPERENDAKRFLLASDFDFWLKIINKVGEKNSEFEDLNTISKEYMDTITNKLKLYRNKVSHLGDNDPSPEMVVRTLRTILDFAEKSDLKKETVIVKKYYLYELYRCYDYDTKHFISYRYDLDFSSYRFPKSPDVPCWKEVCPVIIDVEKSIEIENKNLKEWKREIKEIKGLFFGREELNTDVVKSIKSFYTDISIALPFFSLDGFYDRLVDTYPFHPCFFRLIKNLDFNDKIELARRAIKKALDDDNYDNPLIMPYEIDLNQEKMHDLLVNKFDVSGTPMYSFYQLHEYGWRQAQSILKAGEIKEILENEEVQKEEYIHVKKTVLLLNLRELFRKDKKEEEKVSDMYHSKICANKEWIRLCCFQPGRDIKKYENTLNLLKYGNLLIHYREGSYKNEATVYRTGIYQFLFPSDTKIKNQMETVFDFYKAMDKLGEELRRKLWQINKDSLKEMESVKLQEMKGITAEEDLKKIEDRFNFEMKMVRKRMAIERLNIKRMNEFWFYTNFLRVISGFDPNKFTI